MELKSAAVCVLAGELLERMLNAYHPYYGFASITCSIYDTAWLSMVSKVEDGVARWLFPESFSFLLDQQHKDGAWETYASPIDGILNTAAALLALCRHRETPHQMVTVDCHLDQRIASAQDALQWMLEQWNPRRRLHVGSEILVPALLTALERYNIQFHFNGREALYETRDKKLAMVDIRRLEDGQGQAHSIMHSLEALGGNIDFDRIARHKVRGSMMASPSATAAYLIHASSWDQECEAYLRHVLANCEGMGDGSVPSFFPATLFEFSWVLTTLLGGGFTVEELGAEKLEAFRRLLEDEMTAQNGLVGFAPQIQADADDTAKAITCLNLLGANASTSPLVSAFEQRECFKTYPHEADSSVSTNCNVLIALLSSPANIEKHSAVIIKATGYLCSQWFKAQVHDKWNISSYYTIMLMTQALTGMLRAWHQPSILQERICEHLRQDIELVLFQVLVHVLQTQRFDGAWDGCKEATAYALIAIHTIPSIPGQELPHWKIWTAVRQGQTVLSKDFLQKGAVADRLWIEKVTYGSRNLSDAYLLTALRGCLIHQHRQISECTKADEHISIIRKSFEHLPVLQKTPRWLIEASLFESSLFWPLLQRKCQEAFPNGTGSGRHLIFIPATWTLPARSVQEGLAVNMQLKMMTLSAFLYAIDHHMEAVIGAQGEKERRAVRDAVNAALDRHGTLPDSPSLGNKTLQRFTNYFWHHPKVQSASTPDKTALLTNLRRYFIAHLDQLDDNDCLQQCCTYPISSTEPRYASLFQWIQSTSSHHTGGRLAFSFFLCLIGSGKGTDTLPSPQAKYLGEELSNRLAALSRLENDYGFLDRDRAEGNLNSVDFLIQSQQAATNNHVNSINGDKSSATTATNSTSATAKKHLLRLAEYERRSIRRLLYDDLQPLLSPKTFQALKVFATAVDVFGQMYVQKDHTPRRGRSKSTT